MIRKRSFIAGLISLCSAMILGGCSQMVLLAPKGPIGETERSVIIIAFVLMLIVVIPVIIMALWFSRRYRASNKDAPYTPKWSHSRKIELVIWLFPVAIVTALAILAWTTTYELDPYRPLEPRNKSVAIEAVSLDWKWLFIYPEYHIATINQIVFPVKTPLSFTITSDSVLASFFIPQLGSQIYAMPGKQARLHLLADEPGSYDGRNQQFSGRGFSGMQFKATATTPEQFEEWARKIQQSREPLDLARFEQLRLPVMHFSPVEAGLFNHILREHRQADGIHSSPMSPDSATTADSEAEAAEER
jgi:cytochrome o ubiquinol oxidase subunit 2